MSATLLLTFARCAGFAARAPGFSHPSVPVAARIVLAIALALGIAPGIRTVASLDGFGLILAFGIEALIGAAIGTFASIVYDGAYAGGRVVDDYVGVRAIAPSVSIVAPSGFGRVWSLAFTGGFFLLGVYRLVILAFAQSFELLPAGAQISCGALWSYAVTLPETIVLVALGVAAPAIALSFVVHVALGAIARCVPRFGNITLASPLVFAAAIVATALTVPVLQAVAAHPLLHVPIVEHKP